MRKESISPKSKEAVRSCFGGMTGYLSKFIPQYSSITAPLRNLIQKDAHFHWNKEEQDAFDKLMDNLTRENTILYFIPNKPIVVRAEASYHDRLSAGLFQDIGKGLQPVHSNSRTVTETEKRYSLTEKDALLVT